MAHKLYVLIESIRSAFNSGSIIRTADSAGVNKVYFCGWTPLPIHPKVQKTALGASNSITWAHFCNPLECAVYLKNQQVKLVALEAIPTATNIFHAQMTHDTCLVLGHEQHGISAELLRVCDQICTIPQLGTKSSLNVSTAAGIGMYEYVRKARYNKTQAA